MEWDVNIAAGLGIGAKLDGAGHDHGAVVVGDTGIFAGIPDELAAVGYDACCDRCAIVLQSGQYWHGRSDLLILTPPQPTSITPTLGTLRSVWKS